MKNTLVITLAAIFAALLVSGAAEAQPVNQGPINLGDGNPNNYPDPYRMVSDVLHLPPGRVMGAVSAVAVDHQGHIWVADRCGGDSCTGSPLDPVMEFAADGSFIKAFGHGQFVFPESLFIDAADHLWVADGRGAPGKGSDVLEFDTDGTLLRTLGTPGMLGDGPTTFNAPVAVVVSANGDIFVTDSDDRDHGNCRIVRFDAAGKYLMQWSQRGDGLGDLDMPRALAIDKAGNIYVADRGNNRVEIFNDHGTLVGALTQFSRPTALFIDEKDVLYVSDSESRRVVSYAYNPDWARGIRIGSLRDGIVTAFIPDNDPSNDQDLTSGAEGLWVDAHGTIYAARVRERSIVKYIKK